MFDLGFSEMVVVAIVALVVLGPERLPKAARFVGVWLRRARSQWSSVKDELERDMASEELKRQLNEARSAFSDTHQSLRETADEARTEFDHMRAAVVAEDEHPPMHDHPLDDELMDGRLESANLQMDDESLDDSYADGDADTRFDATQSAPEHHPAHGLDQATGMDHPGAGAAHAAHQHGAPHPRAQYAEPSPDDAGTDDEDRKY